MTDLDKLIAAVEAGEMIAWGISSGFARGALGENWHHGYEAATGSLDAAKALHEALLQGWFYEMSVWTMHPPQMAKVTVGNLYSGSSTSPARAWLLAILKAYREHERKAHDATHIR